MSKRGVSRRVARENRAALRRSEAQQTLDLAMQAIERQWTNTPFQSKRSRSRNVSTEDDG